MPFFVDGRKHSQCDGSIASFSISTNWGDFDAHLSGDFIGRRYATDANDQFVDGHMHFGLNLNYKMRLANRRVCDIKWSKDKDGEDAMKTIIGPVALFSLLAGSTAFAAGPARPPITGVSHISVYSADPAKTEAFYVHDLGTVKGADPEMPGGVRYYTSPTQFVEVLPLPAGPASTNRLDHVAFATPDAEGLRKYLAAKKIKVPAKVSKGSDGSVWFEVADPEGNRVEFTQSPATLPEIPVNPLSGHIIHVGFIVHNRALEDSFFRDVLGFRPYWFGGFKEDQPTWISQQVPDGTDWLEYMLAAPTDGKGIPPGMSQATAGVLNHFSLGVPNAEAAYTLLWNSDRLKGQDSLPKIGRDAKWQINLIDPDGTRAEVMEFHAIGKPCCSPFTATDPDK